jgi:hypothetical protein
MSQIRKIAILRGRHDASTIALTPALEQACQEMLVTSTDPKREAVLEYWTDCTDGYVNFEVTLMPWVDVAFSGVDVNPASGNIPRAAAFNKISAATQALPGYADLSAYDGFICLVAPGTNVINPLAGQPGQLPGWPFDGGSRKRGQKGAFAVYPIATSPHTFMCHEFGHVLGLFDDDGMPWGPGGDTGYGDPLDIMSAQAFAGAWPMFSGTAVPGWPNPNAKDRMGPAPSRAVVHYWNPDAQRQAFVKIIQVQDDAVPPIRLYAAYADEGAPRLLVIDPAIVQPYAIGRTFLEYRDVRKWDRGLEVTGSTLDRRCVVAHVAALRPAPDLNAGDTVGNRCFYRGQIVVPVEIDSDLQIPGTPYTVRVVDANVDEAWVELKVTRSSPAGATIDVTGSDDIEGHDGPIETTHDICGDTLHYATWLLIAHYAFRPVTWGLGGAGTPTGAPPPPLVVRWTVGGVPVPTGLTSGTLPGCLSSQGAFDVDYVIDTLSTLHLSSTEAGQAYNMPVLMVATDPASGASVSAQSSFAPVGRYHGLPWPDQVALLHCLQKIVAVFPPDLKDLRPPPDQPHPNWREFVNFVLERSASQAVRFERERAALQRMLALGSTAKGREIGQM